MPLQVQGCWHRKASPPIYDGRSTSLADLDEHIQLRCVVVDFVDLGRAVPVVPAVPARLVLADGWVVEFVVGLVVVAWRPEDC